jgi:putative ABC transport system permease protein
LEVVRAEDQGVKELDEVSLMMHLSQLQQLIYGKSAPRATSIMLQLRRSDQIPAAQARLAPILAAFSADQPLAVLDFRALNPFYVQTMQMFDTIFGFVFVLIGGIVLFTVSNTMNTTVVERTVEIGTLRAIGLRRSGIRRLFVTEGALLGLCGALLGAVLALVLAVVINQIGMPWLPPGNVELVPFTVNVWGENRMIFGTTFGLIGIATLSAWWPAHRAARLDVVEALRHV